MSDHYDRYNGMDKLGTDLAQLGTNLAEVGTDCISREQAIDVATSATMEWDGMYVQDLNVRIREAIEKLPPIQPDNNSENPNSSDVVSRQTAIDALRKMQTYKMYAGDDMLLIDQAGAMTELMLLPSAEPKRGKWIKTARWGRVYYCDQCRNYLDFDGVNVGRGSTNFCPNCGAKMEVTNGN